MLMFSILFSNSLTYVFTNLLINHTIFPKVGLFVICEQVDCICYPYPVQHSMTFVY